VMGDAVNLASRVEGLTKQYGVGMIVGEATRAACKDIVFRELDRVRAKGKTEPVAIFEPLGQADSVDKSRLDELSLWHQALRLYRAQDWDVAELQLINLQRLHPGTELYPIFLRRVAHFRKNPPGAQWDGTWDFETK
jgi:adenylate cyclase